MNCLFELVSVSSSDPSLALNMCLCRCLPFLLFLNFNCKTEISKFLRELCQVSLQYIVYTCAIIYVNCCYTVSEIEFSQTSKVDPNSRFNLEETFKNRDLILDIFCFLVLPYGVVI